MTVGLYRECLLDSMSNSNHPPTKIVSSMDNTASRPIRKLPIEMHSGSEPISRATVLLMSKKKCSRPSLAYRDPTLTIGRTAEHPVPWAAHPRLLVAFRKI